MSYSITDRIAAVVARGPRLVDVCVIEQVSHVELQGLRERPGLEIVHGAGARHLITAVPDISKPVVGAWENDVHAVDLGRTAAAVFRPEAADATGSIHCE